MPYPIRSIKAPYLWVYYKQMSSFNNNEILFIGSKEYRKDPKLFDDSRYEPKLNSAEHSGYSVPTIEKIESYQFYDFDNTVFAKLEQTHNHNSNQIFRHLLTERIEEIENYLSDLFELITQKHNVVAILSWCNFPSLDRIASKYNLRIIHNELGAFRKPYYQPTAYFDFCGVNGNTESQKRFEEFANTMNEDLLLGLDEIREIMFLSKIVDLKEDERFDVGAALQVEDDSNILAFSNGFDSISLVRWIADNYPNHSLNIREHPSGYLKYDKLGHIDTSVNSIVFLLKCDILITINSSVALEALLFEKRIKILGDNPFAFLMNVDENQKRMALNFAVFGYMIPYDYLFDRDYYMWRLSKPTESEIFHKHLNYYKMKRAGLPQITFESTICSHAYIQLFLDQGNGFTEESSLRLPVAQNTDIQEFVFDLSDRQPLHALRLDPLNDSCVIEIEELKIIRSDGLESDLSPCIKANACSHHGKSYFFDFPDPQVCFHGISVDELSGVKSLIAKIRFAHVGRDAVHVCAKQLLTDKNYIIAIKDKELDQTKTSLIWRVTKPLRKIKQLLKGN